MAANCARGALAGLIIAELFFCGSPQEVAGCILLSLYTCTLAVYNCLFAQALGARAAPGAQCLAPVDKGNYPAGPVLAVGRLAPRPALSCSGRPPKGHLAAHDSCLLRGR